MGQKAFHEFCRIMLVNLPLSHPLWDERGFSQHTRDLLAMEGKVRIGAKSGTNPAM